MAFNKYKLSLFLDDIKRNFKSLIKSQVILSTVTFLITVVGFTIIDVKYRVLIALAITLIDILPLLGSGLVLLPWALYQIFSDNIELGIKLAVLYIILLVSHQILEPLVRGNSMGFSPIVSVVISLISFLIFGGIGLVIGPFLAAIGTSAYKIYVKSSSLSKNE